MKKLLLFLFLLPSFIHGQTLFQPQTIGQPSRNQAVGNGLQVEDTTLLKGRIWLPNLTQVGGATDSVLSIDPVTNLVEFVPQSAGIDTTGLGLPAWALTGNLNTDSTANYIGTNDAQAFVTKVNNTERMRVTLGGNVGIGTATPLAKTQVTGPGSLIANRIFRVTDNSDTTLLEIFGNGIIWAGTHNGGLQTNNLVFGWGNAPSMGDSAESNTIVGVGNALLLKNAERNTFIGTEIAVNLIGFGSGPGFGYENTVGGYKALNQCTTCYENSVWGAFAARALLSGTGNVMVGLSAGENGITQSNCVMVGVNAGRDNTANNSTYVGNAAGWKQTSGEANWVGGYLAMFNSTNSTGCTVTGAVAYQTATSGNFNDVYGFDAGAGLTTGSGNCIWGHRAAKYTNHDNVIIMDNLDRGTAAKEVTHQAFFFQSNADSSAQVGSINGRISFYGINDSRKVINTSAGDAATINAFASRFRKDTSGSTFTLTNALITANSIIDFDLMGDLTSTGIAQISYTCTAGSATITFYDIDVATGLPELKVPAADQDVSFQIIN